jgi:hypothetical protein
MNKEHDLKVAKRGYDAAINALPFMPKEARPYTQQTANRHYDDIVRLEELIAQAR